MCASRMSPGRLFVQLGVYGPGRVLEEQVFDLGHLRHEQRTVDVQALLLCPGQCAAAAFAVELALVIHGVSQPHG